MLAYRRRIVSMVEMVIRFDKPDGIRKLQFEFEDALKDLFTQPSRAFDTQLPVPPGLSIHPGAPARWLLSDGRKTLIASDLSLNLNLNFAVTTPNRGIPPVLQRHATGLDRAVEKVLGKSSILFAGIVVQLNFIHSGPEVEVHRDIADTLLRVPPRTEHNDIVGGGRVSRQGGVR
jgi:hypothetical protein